MTYGAALNFIHVYFEAQDFDEICQRLNKDRREVQNIKAGMKRQGVILPPKKGRPRHGKQPGVITRPEWEKLAKIARILMCKAQADKYRNGGLHGSK